MANVTVVFETIYSQEEEKFIKDASMWEMTREDRTPGEVIKDLYKGDQHKFCSDMAIWLGIRFCFKCGAGMTRKQIEAIENFDGRCATCSGT